MVIHNRSFMVGHLRLGICNACFSQIFEKRTFGRLNEEEESLFMTLRTFDSLCRSCSSTVTLNSSILLTVVTAYGLNQLGLGTDKKPYNTKRCSCVSHTKNNNHKTVWR